MGLIMPVELVQFPPKVLYSQKDFAHGFLTNGRKILYFAYKCTNYYNKESEGSLLWSDETIGIKWEY